MRHLFLATVIAMMSCNGDDKGVDDSTPADDSGDSGGVVVPPEAWSWCPAAAPSGDAAWTRSIEVTDTALLCGAFGEGRTLTEEIAKKAQLRFMPGTLPLPAEEVEGAEVSLPACLMLSEGEEGLTSLGRGSLSLRWNEYNGDVYYQGSLRQPMQDASGAPWTLNVALSGRDDGSLSPIDGSYAVDFEAGQVNAWACEGADCQEYERIFDSCTFDNVDVDRHSFTFEGGDLSLDLHIGDSMAGTEPGIFAAASGTLDGAAFEQTDYWRLVYNPEHHHFSRDAIVFFDEEIGGACGISALNFDPWGEDPATTIQLVDCAGAPIEPRRLSDETWELIE